MKDSCILDWELYQKVMAKKKTIKVCTGVGLDQITPEYITIYLSDIDTEIKKPKTSKKNGKI
jgi:hypothetical protein